MTFEATPNTSSFTLWRSVYQAVKDGQNPVTITCGDDVLTINAEFLPVGDRTHVVGGGRTMTPTQFGEELHREIRDLLCTSYKIRTCETD